MRDHSLTLVTLMVILSFTTNLTYAVECVDKGTGSASKYSCTDYACLQLCHLGHVKKLCQKTCGMCGTSTIGLPSTPTSPLLIKRSDTSAKLSFNLEKDTICPVKQIEFRLTPPAKGGKSTFLLTVKPTETTSVLRGLLSEQSYTLTFRIKSSFGWSLSSSELNIPRTGWDTPSTATPTPNQSKKSTPRKTTATTTNKAETKTKTKLTSTPPTSTTSTTLSTKPPPIPKIKYANNEAAHKAKKRRLIARARAEAKEHQRILRQKEREEKQEL